MADVQTSIDIDAPAQREAESSLARLKRIAEG